MSLFQKFPEFQKFEKKSNNHFLNSPKNEDKIGRGLRGCNETHFPKATRALPCPDPLGSSQHSLDPLLHWIIVCINPP